MSELFIEFIFIPLVQKIFFLFGFQRFFLKFKFPLVWPEIETSNIYYDRLNDWLLSKFIYNSGNINKYCGGVSIFHYSSCNWWGKLAIFKDSLNPIRTFFLGTIYGKVRLNLMGSKKKSHPPKCRIFEYLCKIFCVGKIMEHI